MSQVKQTQKLISRMQDYLATFSSTEGRRVLKDLEAAFYDRPASPDNPFKMAFAEGQRDVVLRIRQMMARAKDDGSQAEMLRHAEEVDAEHGKEE